MVADVSALHNWGHADYEDAKDHIYRQLGRLDMDLFGRQALVGVYVRPAFNIRNGLTFTEKEQQKDWYESKVVLLLAHGPSAFEGDADYIRSMYPNGEIPRRGDWLFQNANTGIQFSFKGDGAERVQYEDRRGDMQNAYPSEGWQVRILLDDGFLGRITKPTSVV